MKFDHIKLTLGLGSDADCWREGWDLSEREWAGPPDFLTQSFIRETCDRIGMSPDIRDVYLRGLSLFDNNPPLLRLAQHCHWCLFQSGWHLDRRAALTSTWPHLPESLHESARLFYGFIALSGVPRALELHRSLGIPWNVTLDTLSDMELWTRKTHRRTGQWGFPELRWMMGHLNAILFRLGRLQFRFDNYHMDYHVFRQVEGGQVVVFAGDGMRFRADGQFADAAGTRESEEILTARFHKDENSVCGNPIHAGGGILSETVTLPLNEWEEVLHVGDTVLSIHIPENGPMDFEACGDSIRQAVTFFPRYFPDRPARGFICHSWLCDPKLAEALPDSNIAKFQSEFYLCPLPGANERQIFVQLFGRLFENLDDVPQTSSLLRAIVGRLKAGKHWHNAGALLFPEDLHWGAQVYRNGKALFPPRPLKEQ